jgi:hypothetical protein
VRTLPVSASTISPADRHLGNDATNGNGRDDD